MQVYVEFALIENFCMDFTLLYCAKLVCKNPAGWRRIALGAAGGAVFAVVFPLFTLPAVASVAVKILSGAVICAVAGRYRRLKSYFVFTAAFTGFTFAVGGALIAVFALAGVNYQSGAGYLISSVPIGVPAFFAVTAVMFARKLKRRLTVSEKSEVTVKLYSGNDSVEFCGFFDSGNRVSYRGSPVSVIPLSAAAQIIDAASISSSVKIHTVTGSKKLKVFTADKMEIRYADKVSVLKNVTVGISPRPIASAALNPDLMEE